MNVNYQDYIGQWRLFYLYLNETDTQPDMNSHPDLGTACAHVCNYSTYVTLT
jgi:hypothetical protein